MNTCIALIGFFPIKIGYLILKIQTYFILSRNYRIIFGVLVFYITRMEENKLKAVIIVIGKDRVGIVSQVSQKS